MPSASVGIEGPRPYVSLVDNEWTVVALLAQDAPASTEQPAIQPASLGPYPPGGPLLVLQQGIRYTVGPVEGPRETSLTCHAPVPSRDRTAVHLPSGRVAYLGITFPATIPRASVTADILEFPTLFLRHVSSPVVQLSGMGVGRLYTVPSTGPGGAVLFTMAEPGVLPAATYRFDVDSPGIGGHHYLYACIGS